MLVLYESVVKLTAAKSQTIRIDYHMRNLDGQCIWGTLRVVLYSVYPFLQDKHKGISHLIEVENPNRILQKMKKVSEVKDAEPVLSRKER
jgi:hypothetical protein